MSTGNDRPWRWRDSRADIVKVALAAMIAPTTSWYTLTNVWSSQSHARTIYKYKLSALASVEGSDGLCFHKIAFSAALGLGELQRCSRTVKTRHFSRDIRHKRLNMVNVQALTLSYTSHITQIEVLVIMILVSAVIVRGGPTCISVIRREYLH
jgi:hypothetical protein